MDPISAWEDGEWEILIDYLAAEAGVFASNTDTAKVGIGTWIYQSLAENVVNNLNTFKAGVSVKGDKVLVSTGAMNALKGLMDAYIEDCGDYIYAPTFSYSDVSTDINQFSNKVYQRFLQDVGNEWTFIAFSGRSYYFMHIDSDQVYLVGAPGVMYNNYVYLSNLGGDSLKLDTYYLRELSQSVNPEKSDYSYNDRVTFPYAQYPTSGYRIVTPTGRPVKVWKTWAALRAYLRGTPSSNSTVYVSSTYDNYDVNNDNSISVDASTINYIFEQGDNFRTDISQVVSNVTQTVNNYYITNGSVMSQEEMQLAIDKALQIFLESLPSGGGEPTDPENPGGDVSGNDPTVSGNDVSGNGVDGPLTVGWLEKIYNTLKDIPGNLVDSLVGVFVPESGYFTEYFNRLNDFFSDKFGFLYSPVDFMIQFFEIFLSIGDAPELTFPGFAILGHTVWEPITVNWEELVADFGLFGYIRIGGDIVIVVAFLNFVQKKCTEVLSS